MAGLRRDRRLRTKRAMASLERLKEVCDFGSLHRPASRFWDLIVVKFPQACSITVSQFTILAALSVAANYNLRG
jgi:hypothetical protein